LSPILNLAATARQEVALALRRVRAAADGRAELSQRTSQAQMALASEAPAMNQCAACRTQLTRTMSVFLWFCLHALCVKCARRQMDERGYLACAACRADGLEAPEDKAMVIAPENALQVPHPLVAPTSSKGKVLALEPPLCGHHLRPLLGYCKGCRHLLCGYCVMDAGAREGAHDDVAVPRSAAKARVDELQPYVHLAQRLGGGLALAAVLLESAIAHLAEVEVALLAQVCTLSGAGAAGAAATESTVAARCAALTTQVREACATEMALLREQLAWTRATAFGLYQWIQVASHLENRECLHGTVLYLDRYLRRRIVQLCRQGLPSASYVGEWNLVRTADVDPATGAPLLARLQYQPPAATTAA